MNDGSDRSKIKSHRKPLPPPEPLPNDQFNALVIIGICILIVVLVIGGVLIAEAWK